jgi:hypothetical protein
MKKLIINNGKAMADSTGKVLAIESDVTITSKGGWQGTAVPNSGYVENVYFNTNLSVEEVVSICSKLKLSEDDISSYVMLIALTEPSIGIAIYKNTDGSYQITDIMNGNIYFHSSFSSEFINEFGFDTGWNPNFNGLISVNFDVFSGNEEEGYVGLQNAQLSTLFSTTPFVQASGESIGLSGEYDGTPIEVTESVDMKALIENKKIPLEINVDVGVHIDGIIKEYQVYAGKNINAGDFITFYQSYYTGLNTNNYKKPPCILLEDNKILIVTSRTNNYYLTAVIVEINGFEMIATTINLSSDKYTCINDPKCILLEDNKAFILHMYGGGNYGYTKGDFYGTLIEIDGTTINVLSTKQLFNVGDVYCDPECILLEDNKIFCAHRYGTDSYLYGTIIEINGLEMIATSTQLNSNVKSGNASSISCVLLEHNKVYISHAYGSSYYLYGTLIEIDGTTINVLNTISIDSSGRAGESGSQCILLENNKVFIAYKYNSFSTAIVKIEGTTMTRYTKSFSTINPYDPASCILLEDNKLFAVCLDSTRYLYGAVIEINDTQINATFTQLNKILHSYDAPSCILLENNKVFIVSAFSNYTLQGTIYTFDALVSSYDSTIDGVAKTSGIGGDTIEVYLPNK